MSTLDWNHNWNDGLTQSAVATTSSNVSENYGCPCNGPKLSAQDKKSVIGGGQEQGITNLERHNCKKLGTGLRSFESNARKKGINNPLSISAIRKIKKTNKLFSSLDKTCSSDMKDPVRTIVQRTLPQKAHQFQLVLPDHATSEVSETMNYIDHRNIKQNLPLNQNSASFKCIRKSSSRSSFSRSLSEREADGESFNVDVESDDKMNVEKKVVLIGKAVSMIPSTFAKKNSNVEKIETRNKLSRSTTMRNRSFDWEKLAMKTKPSFMKHRSQKMLKNRLERYCVSSPESYTNNIQKTDTIKKIDRTTDFAFRTALPNFNQDCTTVDDSSNIHAEQATERRISLDDREGKETATGKINKEDSIEVHTSPLCVIGENTDGFKRIRNDEFVNDTKDKKERPVNQTVDFSVETTFLLTAGGSQNIKVGAMIDHNPKRILQNSNEFINGSKEEIDHATLTTDNAKLKEMWALVAEETLLANNLNNLDTKISKTKENLSTLIQKSNQIMTRLNELRIRKCRLLSRP
ncbi:unnamed protein product [Thelazia callipaeda]|uniref:SCHIP-1 domain-containing protein n=1 Tax=Thelazia callipaeda TaxID=103827 RepID=A0A0N5CL51_THECL|nr:unnamed protein product [Thelazia callipaeda]